MKIRIIAFCVLAVLMTVSMSAQAQPPTLTGITPTQAVEGDEFIVTFTGLSINGTTNVTAGPGISVVVLDSVSNLCHARFKIEPGATPGVREVMLSGPGGISNPVAFTVLPGTGVFPNFGAATFPVTVKLTGTSFVLPLTIDAGSGITVTNASVVSPTLATATFYVSPDAALGKRTITTTSYDGTVTTSQFSVVSPTPIGLETISGTLSAADAASPQRPSRHADFYVLNLSKEISISLKSSDFNTLLYYLGNDGKLLQDDDSGGAGNSMLMSLNLSAGSHLIEVTSTGEATGTYTLDLTHGSFYAGVISPNSGSTGTAVNVMIGDGSYSGARYFGNLSIDAGAGITVSNIVPDKEDSDFANASFIIAPGAALGARNVLVTSPVGTFYGGTFSVVPPKPLLTGIRTEPDASGLNNIVTLTGSNLVSPLTIEGGSGIAVSSIHVNDSTSVTAFLYVTGATGKIGNIVVRTSGGTSNAISFTVAPLSAPTLTGATPSTSAQGTSTTVTLNGTNFIEPETVDAGTGITVTNVQVVGLTSISATLQIAASAALGPRNMSVTTPGGTSNTATFTVIAPPAPTLTSVVPAVGARGFPVEVTFRGSNFGSPMTVDPGNGIQVSNVVILNATSARATLNILSSAALGPRNFTTTASGGLSNTIEFSVVEPFPDLSIAENHMGNFALGFNETYAATVTNAGTSVTTHPIQVSNILPAGLTFVSGTGSGWTCAASGPVVTCSNPGPLAAGAQSNLDFVVAVGPEAVPGVTTGVTVSTNGDLIPGNDSGFDFIVVLAPSAPQFTLSQSPLKPAQQVTVGLSILAPFPRDLTGTLILNFGANTAIPADDPAIQFATGGRQVTFVIRANELNAVFPGTTSARFQTGTVAGTFTFSGTLQAGSIQIPIQPSPSLGTLSILAAVPAITNVRRDKQSGSDVLMDFYSTSKEVTELRLEFNTTEKIQLSCGTVPGCTSYPAARSSAFGWSSLLTFDVQSIFSDWYLSDRGYGSLGTLRMPFTIEGAIHGSVAVRLVNSRGMSIPMSFSLP